MEKSPAHLIIVAGEASGDLHASRLAEAISSLNPRVTLSGWGGPRMRSSGVEIYEDMTPLAVVGFSEVFKHLGQIKRVFASIIKKVAEIKPSAVILVDYPGFNLRLAKELKKQNVRIIYYISPQVWAWDEGRVRIIKKFIDKLLVLFQFEKKFYAEHGLAVDFVGHPLMDTLKIEIRREPLLQSLNLSPDKLTIGLLPGSRQKEVSNLLPVMLDAAAILHKENPKIQFLLIKAPTIESRTIERHIASSLLPIKIIQDQHHIYSGIQACDICMVASGTATLETAILNKPMVVVYKTSLLTWILAKLFIKIPHIGLVNVVAGRKIVPECIQFEANGKKIAEELKKIFTDEIGIAEIKSQLERVKSALGPPGASKRAAEKVLSFIDRT
ncbi:MAG: lipid-A-disaccharide synthase [Candidatus Omnitrophota bacterium]